MAQKKYGYPPKKVRLGFRRFRTIFLLLTTPYVMFESKKLKFLLLIKRKILMAQKKYGYPPKKVRLGFRGFRTYFWEVEHPLWDV